MLEGLGALLVFRKVIGSDSESGEKPQALGCGVIYL